MIQADRPVLYLNLTVINGTEAVKAKVKEKIQRSKLPKSLKKGVGKRAGVVASKRVKPSRIAEKMGTKLCEKMPREMAERGLMVEMEEVFREANYLVIQLQVQHVDAKALERAQRVEYADLTMDDDAVNESTFTSELLAWCLKMIGGDNQKRLEETFLPEKVQAKMETKILETMTDKFEKKGIEADVAILREENQARYFYQKLKDVRQREEADDDSGEEEDA
mmetsp:Transcript_29074/g.54635  ORF Transcript_29074/g.54635 Transcript_29074/m.54635 type:complete len:222 (-) Transcript_29074:176-841(-)